PFPRGGGRYRPSWRPRPDLPFRFGEPRACGQGARDSPGSQRIPRPAGQRRTSRRRLPGIFRTVKPRASRRKHDRRHNKKGGRSMASKVILGGLLTFGLLTTAIPASAEQQMTITGWGGAYQMSQREAYFKPF